MSVFPRKILVATDRSADAEQAKEAASDLARRAEAELRVVHVWHDVPGLAHDFLRGSTTKGRPPPSDAARRTRTLYAHPCGEADIPPETSVVTCRRRTGE